MDDSGTPGESGRWLNYAELAELRGITRKAAIRLTQRHQWRRQPGNDGATRVLVPADIARRLTPRDGGTPRLDNADRELSGVGTSDGAAAAAFTAALAAIQAAHAGEVAALREQLTASQEATRKAQEALEARDRAEAQRKAMGVLARLRAAWRG
jgi:hypothetical protein